MSGLPSCDRGLFHLAAGDHVIDLDSNAQSVPGAGAMPERVAIGPLTLACGQRLDAAQVAFEQWGELSPTADNAVLVLHALTGDTHAGSGPEGPGWWDALIGPGRVLDTNRYAVICPAAIGGCAGSTGPLSAAPDGRAYGPTFPRVTVRDMVAAEAALLRELGVRKLQLAVGGSLGGMRALEWAVMRPLPVLRACAIAATPAYPAIGIAYNAVMRAAITSDPEFADGRYVELGKRPRAGLATARMLGMITYRTMDEFAARFGRARDKATGLWQVESYLRHHGDKLVARFDANAYLRLIDAMDVHDIGDGRGGVSQALREMQTTLLLVGIEGDLLYPAAELRALATHARACGVPAAFASLVSVSGHDAFLLEFEQLDRLLRSFLGEEEGSR